MARDVDAFLHQQVSCYHGQTCTSSSAASRPCADPVDWPKVAAMEAEKVLVRRQGRLRQQVTCCCCDEGQGGILDLY